MKLLRDGVVLGYDEAGAGDPPVLLVHGWGTDRHVLDPLFEHLRRRHRVVSVDLRGFGESDAPRQSYTIDGYALDLAFVAAELGLKAPVVVGHSMGGAIALAFAARGALVSAAVLLEALVVPPAPVRAGLEPLLAGVRSERYRDVVRGFVSHLAGPRLDEAAREQLASAAAAVPQHVLVSALEGLVAFDSEAAAVRVRCPLLYVMTAVRYSDLDRFRTLCPQLATAELRGSGHFFPLEAPDELHAIVDRFVGTALGR